MSARSEDEDEVVVVDCARSLSRHSKESYAAAKPNDNAVCSVSWEVFRVVIGA
jgi:hypothetical protein